MVDILKGLIGAGGTFLLSWVLPSGVFLAGLTLLVAPAIGWLRPAGDLAALAALQTSVGVAFAAMALGLALTAASTPLYRLLEGYAWPAGLRTRGVQRQRRRKQALTKRLEAGGEGWEQALLYEQLDRFPADDAQIAPTALGNAMRAFETYGVDRFNLDSQSLWTELLSVAPEGLRTEMGRARASVDFFVCVTYLSPVFGFAALAAGLVKGVEAGLLVLGVAAVAAAPLWYRLAVAGTRYWSTTVRALVHLGRKPLAAGLGLRLPGTIEEERELWRLVAAFVFYPYDESWSSELDRFRAAAPEDGGGN